MLDSGDNEFFYKGCKEAIEKGRYNLKLKDLQKCFSKEEVEKWENEK